MEYPIGLEPESTRLDITAGTAPDDDGGKKAWWLGRDIVNPYKGLNESLLQLSRVLRKGPIHGVMGFSQGAALATMVASLLECAENPRKAQAVREQGLPVDAFLNLPHQRPLEFLVCFSGYRGTLQYYGSLYQWPLTTRSCHIIATMDNIVTSEKTEALADCFISPELFYHFGTHFVPRDLRITESIARFVVASLDNRCDSTDSCSEITSDAMTSTGSVSSGRTKSSTNSGYSSQSMHASYKKRRVLLNLTSRSIEQRKRRTQRTRNFDYMWAV